MEKEIITTRTPPPPKALNDVPNGTEPVQTVPIDEVRKLIRKVSKEHEGLFRRLAK